MDAESLYHFDTRKYSMLVELSSRAPITSDTFFNGEIVPPPGRRNFHRGKTRFKLHE